MKRLAFLLLLIPATLWGQSVEVLRPTADVNQDPGLCGGTLQGSTSMGNAWDVAGLSTSSNQRVTTGVGVNPHYQNRIFRPWATTTNTYTALTLNTNSASGGAIQGSGNGNAVLAYSINGGSSWTTIRSSSSAWNQTTDPITLSASQDLTQLQVAICVQAAGNGTDTGGIDNIQVWDIWTSGTFTPPPTPTPNPNATPIPPVAFSPIIMSKAWRPRLAGWLIGLACSSYFIFALAIVLRRKP